MSYNVSNNSFSFYTNNSKYIGTYNFILIGALNQYVWLDYNFTVDVQPRCTPTQLSSPSQALVMTYSVGNPTLVSLILPFTPNLVCNGDSIVYSGSLVSSQGIGGSAISFSTLYNSIIVQTNNTQDIGEYNFQITGEVLQDLTTVVVSSSMTFKIYITTSSNSGSSATSNQPPYFSKALSDISMFSGSTLNYQFPSVIDIQNFTVVMSFKQLPSFVTRNGDSLQLNPSLSNVGKYNTVITLTTMSTKPLSTSYTLNIEVIDPNNIPSGISPSAASYLQMHGDLFTLNSE